MSGRYAKKKKPHWLMIAILPLFTAACLLPALLLHRGPNAAGREYPPSESPAAQSESPQPSGGAESAPAEKAEAPSADAPSTAGQPEELAALLALGATGFEELAQINCSQLITVVSDGTSAQIRFFSCSEGIWEEIPQMHSPGHVGRNGVSGDKQEGDGCTPGGLYGIGSAFYISDLPDTHLEIFRITPDTYWVDDPNSAFYNQKVEGTRNRDWSSAEHMISYDVYRYGFVIDYNPHCQKNAGSAIFFHVGRNFTAGCIAADEDTVLRYLKALDSAKCPHILIINGNPA